MTPTTDIDVFVSYARADRERVRPIVEALTAQGLEVWWDSRIAPGAGFDTEIENALDESRCVLVVWSEHSIHSEWVITEASEGLEKRSLVPVSIDDVRPPLAFRRRQTIPLDGANSQNAVDAVQAMLSGDRFEFTAETTSNRTPRLRLMTGLALGLVLSIAAALLWPGAPDGSSDAVPKRVMLPLDNWSVPSVYLKPSYALSPDGRSIVFQDSALNALRVRDLDSLESRVLRNTTGAESPFFSPDGQWVGYFVSGAIYRVPSEGGVPSLIARIEGHEPFGGTWTEDDQIVWGSVRSGLRAVALTGGPTRELTHIGVDGDAHREPHDIRGTKWVLFESAPNQIFAVDIISGEEHFVMDGALPIVIGGEYLTYAYRGSVWVVSFDAAVAKPTGPGRIVQSGVEADGRAYVANRHELIYVPSNRVEPTSLKLIDGEGETLLERGQFSAPRFSPDGRRLAVSLDSGNNQHVYLYNLDTGERTLFAEDAWLPVWKGDGSAISFTRAGVGLVVKTVEDGVETVLVEHDRIAFSSDWAEDGRFVFNTMNPETSSDMFLRHPDGKIEVLEQDETEHWSFNFAENERLGAMVFQGKIIANELPGVTPRWTIGSGIHPRWQGNEKVFYQHKDELRAVNVTLKPELSFSEPYSVAKIGTQAGINPRFDVSQQGTLAVVEVAEVIESPVMLSNWLQ